jgi:formylglycine-generating enzyme required for sulfatase activity
LKPELLPFSGRGIAKSLFSCYRRDMGLFSHKPPVEILAEDEVRLKPLLGVRPEVYVPAFFALFLAAAIFFLFFFPALVKPGSVVPFRSEPFGAAVYVDGVYAGQTPCDVFVAQGEHKVTLTMAGFHDGVTGITVKNRLPGFRRQREEARLTLKEESPNAALLAGAREFAAWSFTLEPTEVYQIPLVLSEGAYRSGSIGDDEAARIRAKELLTGATRFTQSKAGMKDLIRALFLTGNGGNAPSPLSLASSVQDALLFLQENPESAAWLAAVLPAGARKTLTASGWYAAMETMAATEAAKRGGDDTLYIPATGTVSVEAVTFIRSGEDLWAASTPVTAAQFARFTEATPEWRAENAETLAAQGLATTDYLIGVEDTRYPIPTVGGVSWYAADAYCRWLTSRLPASLSGWTAVLPTETEWEQAAATIGVEGAGTIWEWCADPFAPFPAFRTDAGVIADIGSPEKLVRGASWAKPPAEHNRSRYIREARGSAPPESSTPFVSFRPVLARRSHAVGR